MTRGQRTTVERHLTEDELDEAIREAKTNDEIHLLQRLVFIKNRYFGDAITEAAERVGASQSAGNRWIHEWNEAGVDGLRPSFGGGRPAKLNQDEKEELAELLEANEPWTTAEILALIEDRFDVEYSRGYLPRLLRSLGMTYAKPRPEDPDRPADAEEILADRLEETLEEIEDGRTPVVGFFRRDESADDG